MEMLTLQTLIKEWTQITVWEVYIPKMWGSNIYLFKMEIKKISIFLICGWREGSQKLKILKSSETSKSAVFSFAGGPTYIFWKHKKLAFFLERGGGLRTYHIYYNVSSYVLSNGNVNTSITYQGMDPNHCLRGLYTKDGGSNIYLLKTEIKKISIFLIVGRSQKLKILKSSETSKSAVFSFAGGPTYIFWNRDKKLAFS